MVMQMLRCCVVLENESATFCPFRAPPDISTRDQLTHLRFRMLLCSKVVGNVKRALAHAPPRPRCIVDGYFFSHWALF
jgi:hypothetical protein